MSVSLKKEKIKPSKFKIDDFFFFFQKFLFKMKQNTCFLSFLLIKWVFIEFFCFQLLKLKVGKRGDRKQGWGSFNKMLMTMKWSVGGNGFIK